jgi:DNA modification methylase
MTDSKYDRGQEFIFDTNPVIKGYPELRWTGKRPYRSTQYYPAQLRESYGDPVDGPDGKPWMNKIYWGDNLQVMSYMLKEFRGKIDLIYIDPPFDSKADYKKKIKLKGKSIANDSSVFEEKQYGDIWSSDEYLQFMYERLILMRELLSSKGSIFLHCDWHRSHHLRMLLDEVFGPSNFINEISWCYFGPGSPGMRQYNRKHDTIFWYCKAGSWTFNSDAVRVPHDEKTSGNFRVGLKGSGFVAETYELADGKIPEDWWEFAIAGRYPNDGVKRVGYPTEKPYKLLERIILGSSNPGDIVFDPFAGSGVTQMVALQNSRRFIGADINLGAIQTTTKRLLNVARDLTQQISSNDKYLGFEVFNVNNYEFFRNPVEAKDLLIQALDIQPLSAGVCFDGELDGRMVKILPTNRIATRADLKGLVAELPYDEYDARRAETPSVPVDHITLVCMGHEPDLKACFESELNEYNIDVQVVDVLQDKRELEFKREAEARIEFQDGMLVIQSFYPMNLLQKLSMQKETVDDWRELVDSVMIDWNYDGAVMEPTVIDIPESDGLVSGSYEIPNGAGHIKVKITDVLSESLELEVGA